MNTQVNWKKIRNEFQRLADVDTIKAEVTRIGTEIRKFDYNTVLSPAAKSRVKTFERRYAVLMRTLHQAQRQVDREFNRILRQIKVHRSDVNKVVAQQKKNLEQASTVLKKRFGAKAKKASRPRTATRKAATKRRRKG